MTDVWSGDKTERRKAPDLGYRREGQLSDSQRLELRIESRKDRATRRRIEWVKAIGWILIGIVAALTGHAL